MSFFRCQTTLVFTLLALWFFVPIQHAQAYAAVPKLAAPTNANTKISIPAQPTYAPRLRRRWVREKRADVLPVCTSGQTSDCVTPEIASVTSTQGGHYVPVCDAQSSCYWLGYDDPDPPPTTIDGTSYSYTTSYSVITTASEPFILPIPIPIIPPGEPPVIPPPIPPEEIDPPPEPPQSIDLPTLTIDTSTQDETTQQETTTNPPTTTEPSTTTSGCTSVSATIPVEFDGDVYTSMLGNPEQAIWAWRMQDDDYYHGCSAITATTNFNGEADVVSPQTWCGCAGKIYSYATDTGCAHHELPSATISLSKPTKTATGATKVTSCSVVSTTWDAGMPQSGADSWCTCNDNAMHMVTTVTSGGSKSIGCVPTMTETDSGSTSTESASPTTTSSSETPTSTPIEDRICNIYLYQRQGGSGTSEASPYKLNGGLTRLTDDTPELTIGGVQGEPKACGAKKPCKMTGLNDTPIELLPIKADKKDKWSMYTHVVVGDVYSFRTDTDMLESSRDLKKSGPPGCTRHEHKDPVAVAWNCRFNCGGL